MVQAIEVTKSQEQVLYNLLQKYLYEMSAYDDRPMDDEGNFSYQYLPYYFTEKDRQAFFLYDDSIMIGFALINAYSVTAEPVANCIAEFTIFPAYRHRGKGLEAIEALKAVRHGSWQLKYATTNKQGAAFWKKVKEQYNGIEQKLEGTARVITFA